MISVWNSVEAERIKYRSTNQLEIPVDVFSLAEIDLGLNIIPFPDLDAKYRIAAALRADFTGIYVDEKEYVHWEKGPVWKTKRLRFSVAHELGHFFLHQKLPQVENFSSLPDFARWCESYDGKIYSVEEEANEFAGRLLVPKEKLMDRLNEIDRKLSSIGLKRSDSMRTEFCEAAGSRFLVSETAIAVRLDREGLWPVN
jgi:Zn-dependent peptidase ImmA (M78 family)